MSQPIRLAILGAGATGKAHASGAKEAGGFKLAAVADLIPARLTALASQFSIPQSVADAEKVVIDPNVDAVCICLPTHLHAPVSIAALKAGKHVLIENPPASSLKDTKAIAKAAEKYGKVVLYSAVRRFGAAEQSAKQAIDKAYAGKIYHARATWLRTRGVPRGTGWYDQPEKSGGGAVVDLALPIIDLLLHLLGDAKPQSVYAVSHNRLEKLAVEEAGALLMKFTDGTSAEITCSWALNQPPGQSGTTFRLAGETGAIDLYTPQGPTLYRGFDAKGQSKATPMKQPRVAGHAALLRHFKDCIQSKAAPIVGPAQGVQLMEIAEAIYKSIASGKSVEIR
jgi:predicted dehydrogenase